MRLEFNEEERRLIAKAESLEASSKDVRKLAHDMRDAREKERPLIDRLFFSAGARCECGLGLAYDPLGLAGGDKESPLHLPNQWECSGILLGTADQAVTHTRPLSFSLYEVKSENQPSANGATTRPKAAS